MRPALRHCTKTLGATTTLLLLGASTVLTSTPHAGAASPEKKVTVVDIGSVASIEEITKAVKDKNIPKEHSGTALLRSGGRYAIADLSMTSAQDPEGSAAWAATSESVQLIWAQVEGVKSFQVRKDGVPLGEVKGNSFTDTDVVAGQQVEYVVQGSDGASVEANGRTWGLAVTVPSASGKSLDSMEAAAEAQITAAADTAQTSVVHETFIPQAYLTAPPLGCGSYNGSSYSFGGDNRGYAANSSRYRTRLVAYVNWTAAGAVSTYKSVGSTSVYRTSTKALLSTRTASTSQMNIARLALSSSTLADLRFTYVATKPSCTSFPNAIEGAFTMSVTRSGSWRIISGSHRQMPNTELYISRGGLASTAWTTAYQRSYASTACLLAFACERANYTGSGTY